MIELIVILCLIWNTVYLLSSRQESYVSSGWEDYEFKFTYSKPADWGFCQLLIIPKVRGSFQTPKVNQDE